MALFIARQPILDARSQVVAYELLHRSSMENRFTHGDLDEASTRVIHDSLLTFGLASLTQGRNVYVNVTRHALVARLIQALPAETTVVEILENVQVDDDVISACRALKQAGYRIARDDFTAQPQLEPLYEFASIIKVDFRAMSPEQRAHLAATFKPRGMKLLAEKVETREEFSEAVKVGYDLFQGYFFFKPEVLTTREIPAFKLNYLRFLNQIHRPELDFKELEKVIRQELSLSVKLLRFLNSAAFAFPCKINSIGHALTMLGERQTKNWASLVAVANLGDGKPTEVVVTSLIRARFCELLGKAVHATSGDYFLLGLLSVMDTLLDRPLPDVLAEVMIPDEARNALLGKNMHTSMGRVYGLVSAYERADFEAANATAIELKVKPDRVAELYRDAVVWADQVFSPSTLTAPEPAAAKAARR